VSYAKEKKKLRILLLSLRSLPLVLSFLLYARFFCKGYCILCAVKEKSCAYCCFQIEDLNQPCLLYPLIEDKGHKKHRTQKASGPSKEKRTTIDYYKKKPRRFAPNKRCARSGPSLVQIFDKYQEGIQSLCFLCPMRRKREKLHIQKKR